MRDIIINYYKDMIRRGYIGKKEIDFFKQGVVFDTLKLVVYGMRPDEL